ncbi:phage portal protein [Flavobacterium sp. SUN046]|uniref:phage portal protein n=1 Tax=Flavobacterium sp. SUN046 TaxID=3002440 RepID=UPI002DB617E1|nr:phage portal protein [Flavobacterium sp. SUN046]MEC4050589.1 phage portal protein [Flavobacterium sp. SUN046]
MPSPTSGGTGMIFQAILSNAWETIDQNFYTRLAQTVDPIDSTITFYAEILSSGILKSFDKNDNEVENDALVELLKQPNENQNFQQFIKEWLYYHYSHGWNYVVPQSTSVGFERRLGGNSKTSLYNCDPDHIVFNNQGTLWNFFSLNKETNFDYKPYSFRAIKYKDVISFYDVRQNPERPYIGVSRLLSLRQQIQNYYLSLQGKENLIKRSGSTLVSLDAKTEDMGMDSEIGTGQFDKDGNPITTTHKEKLEEQLRATGLGTNSMGIMFSTLPLKSTPLSQGLENINFDRLSVEDARQILNKFNLPKEFQNLTSETAKFQNRQMAMIEVIQNTIEPLASSFCDKIRAYFNWENKIVLDFSHLPVFSDNEQTKITTQQSQVDMYIGLNEKGLIDDNQLKKILQDYGII